MRKTDGIVLAILFGFFILFAYAMILNAGHAREECLARGGQPQYFSRTGIVCFAPGTLR